MSPVGFAGTGDGSFGESRVGADFDWRAFLGRLDPVWNPLVHRPGRTFPERPASARNAWGEAALLGNGMLGASAYKKNPEGLSFEIGRNDAEALQFLPGVDWCEPRLVIGDLVLQVEPIPSTGAPDQGTPVETMRLHLWDAEASGVVQLSTGSIEWRSFIPTGLDVLVLETRAVGSVKAKVRFQPARGVSNRLQWVTAEKASAVGSLLSPEPLSLSVEGATVWHQVLNDDAGRPRGSWSAALAESDLAGGRRVHAVAVAFSREGEGSKDSCIRTLREAMNAGIDVLTDRHRAWWHGWYPRSLLSISDTRWESFYWIQMYKLACATRGHFDEAIDNQGPWATDCGWPGTWWNLNVQLSYSPLARANRLDLFESLPNAIRANRETIIANAAPITPEGMYLGRASGRACTRNSVPSLEAVWKGDLAVFELGNFTWIAKLLHDRWEFTRDEAFLRELAFPVLRAAVNVPLAVLRKGDDGRLHLPRTTSPEYPDPKDPARNTSCPSFDTSYDLALLRWGLETLLRCVRVLGVADPLETRWRESLRDLAPFCVNENGLMVAKDLPFEVSHRHYSHLFALYPLVLLDLDLPEEKELAKKSFAHWIGKTGALQGYSFTGAASMASLLEDGDLALKSLNGLLEYVLPNTMYVEGGGPVIETPLSGAESMQMMLLHSVRGILKVFPAIPSAWSDVRFERLLGEGGFEVSAYREAGVNRWVAVMSLAGSPLVLRPGLSGEIRWSGGAPVVAKGNGTYEVDLAKGEEIVFFVGSEPDRRIRAVVSDPDRENHWGGFKEGMGAMARRTTGS